MTILHINENRSQRSMTPPDEKLHLLPFRSKQNIFQTVLLDDKETSKLIY
jgi:hypothetical protein